MIGYDERKNIIRNHGISIPEQATIFDNNHSEVVIDIPDENILNSRTDILPLAGHQQAFT